MSNCAVGCQQSAPHLTLGGLYPLGYDYFSSAESVPAPDFAWYQDTPVEVTDPVPDPVFRLDIPTFESTLDALWEEVRDLIIDRQTTYGPTNIEQQGLFGIVNRISNDKVARIKKRLNGEVVNGEIVLDPIEMGSVNEPGFVNDLADVIGYGVCGMLLARGEWGRPLESER